MMTAPSEPALPAIDPATVPARTGSTYPEPYASRCAGRAKRALGNALGLRNFGVNLVEVPPGVESSMRHWHERQDEFVYMLEGELVLITDAGEQILRAGMAAGFPAGNGDGHQLVNRSGAKAVYLEVGDRMPGDGVIYSDIDMVLRHDDAARHAFRHKDGTPY
jgi:uncharacterized cupin superfamily protein